MRIWETREPSPIHLQLAANMRMTPWSVLALITMTYCAEGSAQRLADVHVGVARAWSRPAPTVPRFEPSSERSQTGMIVGALIGGLLFGGGVARLCENECTAATTFGLLIGIPLGAVLGMAVADMADRGGT